MKEEQKKNIVFIWHLDMGNNNSISLSVFIPISTKTLHIDWRHFFSYAEHTKLQYQKKKLCRSQFINQNDFDRRW